MTGSVKVETPLGYTRTGSFRVGQTIAEIYREQGLPPSVPVICVRNGKPLLRARKRKGVVYDYRRWEVTRARAKDELAFVAMLQGGGGDSKNILRTVAMIGVAIAAIVVGGPLGGVVAGALEIGTTTATALVQLGVVLGGTFLVSALLPVTPATTDPTTAVAQATISPTYSIGPVGNQARLLQPIPKQYGRLKVVPDLIAQPYTKFIGNDQYLFEVFSLGIGKYENEEVRISDAIVYRNGALTGAYPALELEFKDPNQTITLFDTGVETSDEVAGQEIRKFGSGILTVTGVNTITISANPTNGYVLTGFRAGDVVTITGGGVIDGTYTVDHVDNVGQMVIVETTLTLGSYPGASIGTDGTTGPFAVCRPGRKVTKIEYDYVFPNGLGFFDTSVPPGFMNTHTVSVDVYIRPIDDDGNPLGPFVTTGPTTTFSNFIRTPIRLTGSATVALARYETKVVRTSLNDMRDQYFDVMQWVGLKGYFADDNTFPYVSTMAMKLRATEISQSATRNVSVLQTAFVQPWDNVNHVLLPAVASRSPAWAALDLVLNSTYGMGRPLSQIDTDQLTSLSATYDGNGDTFDGVFDTQRDSWSALKDLLAAVRTQPVAVGNILTFVRDAPLTLARGVFTPRNIRKGSLEITHIMVDNTTPDDVIVEFLNEATWIHDEVECTLPGSTSANPAHVSLFGVVQRAQAEREGFFLAATNKFRRVLLSFSTELEGKLLIKGDAILVSHDVVAWGQSGEVASWDGNVTLTLSEDLNWGDGTNMSLLLSQKNNQQWGPALVTQGSAPNIAVIQNIAALVPIYGSLDAVLKTQLTDQVATRYQFGQGTTYAKRCKVIAITPQDMQTYRITAVVDDDRVYQNFV